MFTRVSVLIPTRHRIERLETLLSSYRHTASPDDSELVFRVDDDDLDTQNFLCSAHNVVIGPRGKGYADMPKFFNELAAAASGDVLMCGNDDMVFQTVDWAERILEVANGYPDGLFDIGVSTMNQDNFPFSIVSKRAVEKMGFLWDPRIFWGDIFLRDVMAWYGRALLLPGVRVDHDWAGFKPDKVYVEQLMPGEGHKDINRRNPNYWTEVHAVAVNEAVGRLRGLLA